MSETRKFAPILVADVVGYGRLAGADEDRTVASRGLRSDLIDPAIAAHHGYIIERTGDGSIIEFRRVGDAVRCAIETLAHKLCNTGAKGHDRGNGRPCAGRGSRAGMVERNADVPEDRRIPIRIGTRLGDVVEVVS